MNKSIWFNIFQMHCSSEQDLKNIRVAFSDVCVLAAQSCPTLCDPTNCSLLGFSVHGILQARILEWVAKTEFQTSLQDSKTEIFPKDKEEKK